MKLARRGIGLFLDALKANWIPAIGIWLLGAAVALGYYHLPWVHEWGTDIVELRGRTGLWYSLLATATFGAVLPTATQFILMKDARRTALLRLPWLFLYWGYRGIESDYFYRFQAWCWGADATMLVVTAKVATDMFVYNPIVTPEAMYLRWVSRRLGELPPETKIFPKSWYRKIVIPWLFFTWALWIPAATFMYMLPTELQLPMENLILWLWSLMLIFVTKEKDEPEPEVRVEKRNSPPGGNRLSTATGASCRN